MNLDREYWDSRYVEKTFGWDIGYPSPALIDFASTFDKSASILIPGCGHAYEGEWLWNEGFKNLTLMDLSPTAANNFFERVPDFPKENFLLENFFEHSGNYDLILEQTFFCALNPELRSAYAKHMKQNLTDGGTLAGLLFTFPLTEQGPPFGGSLDEYSNLFNHHFEIEHLEPTEKSIAPRMGKEAFFILKKTQ